MCLNVCVGVDTNQSICKTPASSLIIEINCSSCARACGCVFVCVYSFY